MDDAIDVIHFLRIRLDKFESNFKKCSHANRTKGYLEGRLKGLKDIWKSICETDATINDLKTAQNENIDYFENDEFGGLEEEYFVLVGQINEYLNAFNPQPQINQNANNNQNQNQRQDNQSKVKLRKISLPSFDGSYHTWLSFKNRFTNLIHNNLAPSEKLEYLKSCVKEDAERKIRRYQITDENYKLAWDHLNEEYDNQRILQATQVETIVDRRVIKTKSAKELRELIDITQECLESLKNLNVDASTWDIMLIVLVTRKLPLRTRELWEEELKPKDVPQLCEFLEKRYRTLESLELIGKSDVEKGESNPTQGRNDNEGRFNQPRHQRFNCIVCNIEPHLLTKCDKFLDMSILSRKYTVKSMNICENCLGTNHISSNCRNQKRGCCVIIGYMYVVGGIATQQSIEKYDEVLDKWITIHPTLSIPRDIFGTSAHHQKCIYICGRFNQSFEKINVDTGERVQLSSMQQITSEFLSTKFWNIHRKILE